MSPSNRRHSLSETRSYLRGIRKPWVPVALALLAIIVAAPAVQASTVTKCNAGTFGVYYVLFNESVQTPLVFYQQSYNTTPPSDPLLPQEPRRYDELLFNPFEPPSFYAMCSNDIYNFETLKGIHRGDPVAKLRGRQSELHDVIDNNSNQVVGTVWLDQLDPVDQGGAIAGQSYWRCGVAITPTLLNYAGFSSGVDIGAINDTSEEDKELFYMRHIRERFMASVTNKMTSEECTQLLTKADFIDMLNNPLGSPPQVWFRDYDPTDGGGDTK